MYIHKPSNLRPPKVCLKLDSLCFFIIRPAFKAPRPGRSRLPMPTSVGVDFFARTPGATRSAAAVSSIKFDEKGATRGHHELTAHEGACKKRGAYKCPMLPQTASTGANSAVSKRVRNFQEITNTLAKSW